MMYENFRHTHGSGSGAGKIIQFFVQCSVDEYNLISFTL